MDYHRITSIGLHRTTILAVLFASLQVLAALEKPAVIWTQRSYKFSKFRALTGHPDQWLDMAYKPYRFSFTDTDKFRYAVDIDARNDEILWTDRSDGTLYKQTLEDSLDNRKEERLKVLSGISNQVNDITIDWLSGTVYFTDEEHDVIALTSTRPQEEGVYKVLFTQDLEHPWGIAVDPYQGMLFWTIYGDDDRIESSTTDGRNRKVIQDSRFRDPRGLTLDYKTQKIYFVDRHNTGLYKMDYSGQNLELFYGHSQSDDSAQNYFGISLWENFLFVTTEKSLQLHVYDTEGELKLQAETDAYAYSIAVSKDLDIPEHDCPALGCQHFCLNENGREGHCECADGYFMLDDRKSCAKTDPYILYTAGDMVMLADIIIDEWDPMVISMEHKMVAQEYDRVAALAMHYEESLLYFSDTQRDVVYKGDPSSKKLEWVEHTVNTRRVEGMAVDWLSDNVYWADADLNHIMVSKLSGHFHRILIDGLDEPRGLAVDPINGFLYWSQASGGIMRANLDGTDIITLTDEHVEDPQGLTFDARTNILYWVDQNLGTIESVDISDTEQEPEVKRVTDVPGPDAYDVTSYLGYVIWTEGKEGLLFANASTGDRVTIKENIKPDLEQSYDLVTFDLYSQKQVEGPCNDGNNGGCEQLCFPTPEGASCNCGIGYKLRSDRRTCESSTSQLIYLFNNNHNKHTL